MRKLSPARMVPPLPTSADGCSTLMSVDCSAVSSALHAEWTLETTWIAPLMLENVSAVQPTLNSKGKFASTSLTSTTDGSPLRADQSTLVPAGCGLSFTMTCCCFAWTWSGALMDGSG